MSISVHGSSWTPYTGGAGHATYDSALLSAVITLATAPLAGGVTIPSSATVAVISVEGKAVRVWNDGANPTATEGVRYPPGLWVFEGREQLLAMKIIREAAGAAINVEYYTQR